MELVEKVTCFVADPSGRLALFRHPHGGTQIPAGTVEEGEAAADAALREAYEETGLDAVLIDRRIAVRDEELPDGWSIIGSTSPVHTRPDPLSPAWATIRNGLRVRVHRHQDAFAQVSYTEYLSHDIADGVSFQITGWIDAAALAPVERRHFYLLSSTGSASDEWRVRTDGHEFTVFWSDPDDLSAVTGAQQGWVRILEGFARGGS